MSNLFKILNLSIYIEQIHWAIQCRGEYPMYPGAVCPCKAGVPHVLSWILLILEKTSKEVLDTDVA